MLWRKGSGSKMEIKIENVRPSNHATIKGNFDVLFPDLKLKIKECRLVKKKAGEEYFIGFPSYKNNDGSYVHHIFMEDKENPLYQQIIDQAVHAVLEAQRTAS
jgi:DNA-binding cell septation regulator SpoVG